MHKNIGQLTTRVEEDQLNSKQAILLPSKERLLLLLNAKHYPVARKRTSAVKQLEEMINFYNICCIMLVNYFSNEESENNYISLALLETITPYFSQSVIPQQLAEAFKSVENYEIFERKITSIQNFFWEYRQAFPEIFEHYNLEELALEKICEKNAQSRYLLCNHPEKIEKIKKHWGLI